MWGGIVVDGRFAVVLSCSIDDRDQAGACCCPGGVESRTRLNFRQETRLPV